MKIISKYDGLNIPEWSLCYLVNGDYSGLEEKEKNQVDNFVSQFYAEAEEHDGGDVIFSTNEDEGSFVRKPEFGLGCNCIESTIFVVKRKIN